MLNEAPLLVVVCAAVMLLLLAPAIVKMPSWWRGTSRLTPDNPPPGWSMPVSHWRRLAHGLMVGVPMMGCASLAVLFSHVSMAAADVLLWFAAALAVVWLSAVVFARPRFLIPPTWRPDRAAAGSRKD